MSGHRRLVVLRGRPDETQAPALAQATGAVLWVGTPDPELTAHQVVAPNVVKRLLGTAYDTVVLDAHAGLDADILGQVHGFIRGGGTLILRLPAGPWPPDEALAVWPWTPAEVGQRFAHWVEAAIARTPATATPVDPATATQGTEEQARVVERLAAVLDGPPGGVVAVLSDRGRGKSSALGLALNRLPEGVRVAVTAGQPDSVAEVQRFAPGPVRFVDPSEIAFGNQEFDVLLVDEAAQIPVPVLQRMVQRQPRARIAFATTTRGYEGTGRGFVLRFLAGLAQTGQPAEVLRMEAPIRWAAGDPLERFVFDALLLDAEPARLTLPIDPAAIEAVALDRDALAADPERLRGFFGLLVHAHYRTTPGDLHRLLDAPNVHLHALLHAGQVVAATLVAVEGRLPAATCEDLARGRCRLRGHALPETLVVHGGQPAAGQLAMVRSVRIATHPELRRLGLGRRLIDHVHAFYGVESASASGLDLIGTLFGATAELLRFRRAAGYVLVRVGASRGSRTGEPAAVMIRPISAAAHALVDVLRQGLARDLPTQLAWMQADDLCLDPELEQALLADLPETTALSDTNCAELVADYAHGPRTLEAVLVPLGRYVAQHTAVLGRLDRETQRLLQTVVAGRGWRAVAGEKLSIPAAMRAVRRAVRALVAAVAADPEPTSEISAG